MSATIYFATDRDRVFIGEIPELLASALVPDLPADSPRVLSYLTKEAIRRRRAKQKPDNGDVRLTDADMQALNAGAWSSLPPLSLGTKSDTGPCRLAQTLTEPQWEPYAAALAAGPLKAWKLVPCWRNPLNEQAIRREQARADHERKLTGCVTRGEIRPRNKTTGIEELTAAGEWLKSCYVSVPEFREYAAGFLVAVELRREFIRRPLVVPLVAELKKLPCDEWVAISEELASRGGPIDTTVRDVLRMLEDIAARQSADYFTLDEAASILCEEHQQLSPERLIEPWKTATINGRRLVRGADRLPRESGDMVSPWHDLVKASEVDAWHEERGDDYRLSEAVQSAYEREGCRDGLAPEKRREHAAELDANAADPRQNSESQYWRELMGEILRVEQSIAEWEATNDGGIPSEVQIREQRLKDFKTRLQRLNAIYKLPPFLAKDWADLSDAKLAGILDAGGDAPPGYFSLRDAAQATEVAPLV